MKNKCLTLIISGLLTAHSMILPAQNPVVSPYLDSVIMAKMEIGHIAGLSSCIIKNGEVSWIGNYGYANIEQEIPVDTSTLFYNASISKTVTATPLFQLWEEGVFGMDDDINDYLPFDVHNPNYPEEPITFRMLCTHTSSIDNNAALLPVLWGEDPSIPLGQFLFDYLDPEGANYNPTQNYQNVMPGTVYNYGAVGVALLGHLVEVLADSTFSFITKDRVFDPLQMNESAWFLSELDTAHIAVPYSWNGSTFVPYDHYSSYAYPATTMRSSVDQLANLLLAYMNGGSYLGEAILQASTIDSIMTPQIPSINSDRGLIWYRMTVGGRVLWGHEGNNLGATNSMRFCPEENTGVIIYSNSVVNQAIGIQLLDLLFDYAADSIPCSCLPEGITFTTQEQIDSFQMNYPGCTEIEGDVIISGDDIANLEGLNMVNSFGGSLSIEHNESLNSLIGLESLTHIQGSLDLHDNDSLMSLTALNALTYSGGLTVTNNNHLSSLTGLGNLALIGGDLYINMNGILENLCGLNNLAAIDGDFRLGKNDFWAGNWFLEDLEGLENLITIGGDFIVISNISLTSMSAMENLTSIGGSVEIHYNDALTSLEGLENIDPGSISDLYISNNHLLSECNIQSICEKLATPTGNINIEGNAPGCSSQEEILANCNNPLLNFTFNTQEEIDSFQFYYPGMSEIEGNVMIAGGDINNLEGLNALTSVGDNLSICGNAVLSNLIGLDQLTTIGGDLIIGSFFPQNFSLSSLTGLENLTSIGGNLVIRENDSLASLDGLENIDPGSMYDLTISHNDLLSECSIQSICNYLAAPNGNVSVFDNAPGCNSPEEVEEACLSVYIEDKSLTDDKVHVYPNPVFDHVNISGIDANAGSMLLRIFNGNGRMLFQNRQNFENSGEQKIRIDMSPFSAGMYFIQLQSGGQVFTKKVIKR